jgi:hypothetical protein
LKLLEIPRYHKTRSRFLIGFLLQWSHTILVEQAPKDMDIQKIIADQIVKELPASVTDAVMDELQRLKKIEADYNESAEKLTKLEAKSLEDWKQISRLQEENLALIRSSHDLNSKAEKVLEGERNLEITLLKAQFAAKEESAKNLTELVSLVFRNPQVRRSVTETSSGFTPGNTTNNWQQQPIESKTVIITEVEEQA